MCTAPGAWNTNIKKPHLHPQTQVIYLEEKHISPSIPYVITLALVPEIEKPWEMEAQSIV